jgi:neopullulanase
MLGPDWVKDAIFYQIFPDRFARSARLVKPTNLEPWSVPPTRYGFKGGDLLGVLEHLDYLEALGINALYFNPIFQSAANHRYHTHDYFRVDAILGGDQAFRELVDAAHARGIRIILDGVFNHASRGFFQFNHILENGLDSPYLDWFIVKDIPLWAYHKEKKPNYEAWFGMHALPKLNTDNPQVRDFIFEVAEYWLNQGIDGWRLDVPLDIKTPGFWETFRQRVRRINPEVYLLAEIWDEAQPWLQGEHFDAVMNYTFNRACYGFFGGKALDTSERPGGFRIRRLDARNFARSIDRSLSLYPWDVVLGQYNLLSSHDEPRFLTMVKGDRRRLRLATLFQMVFPGAPGIYYGDEIGMEGGRDPDCRRSFSWDEKSWDHELLADFRRFIALRHAHPVLRRGDFATLHAKQYTYACARIGPEEIIVVAFNMGTKAARIELDMQDFTPDGAVLTEAWTQATLPVVGETLTLKLAPMSARVLIYQVEI